MLASRREVDTLFVGGGTPTYLPPESLRQFFAHLRQWFALAAGAEFSVEANPSGLDDERLDLLAEAGVNRVSLGVQSFDPRQLALLERDHTAGDVHSACERLRRRGIDNLSFDLIFGVPGQSLDNWERTLVEAVTLRPRHLSTYGLTFETGTAFWTRREQGRLIPAGEENERAMYEAAMDRLPAAGFEQYEISNFARPGFRCRHNEVYWRGEGYFAFGPGAASYVDGLRRTNRKSVTGWIDRVLAGEPAFDVEERLGPEERAREAIMLGLRRCEGIDLDAFETRFGTGPVLLEPDALRRNRDAGLVEIVEGKMRLTREGRLFADHVASQWL